MTTTTTTQSYVQRRANEPLWTSDPSLLARYWTEFFPAAHYSAARRTNALVRMVLFAGVAVFMYNRQPKYVAWSVAVAIILTMAHKGAATVGNPVARVTNHTPREASTLSAATGFDNVKSSAEASVEAKPTRCTRPTRENPFGNVLLTEYNNADRAPACAYDDVKDEIRKFYNEGLPRNMEDIYERENGQLIFRTMPVTQNIPDTKAYREFLWGDMIQKSCKQDPENCGSLKL